jgi:hypothetical protein
VVGGLLASPSLALAEATPVTGAGARLEDDLGGSPPAGLAGSADRVRRLRRLIADAPTK